MKKTVVVLEVASAGEEISQKAMSLIYDDEEVTE